MKQALKYSLRVWLTGVATALLIIWVTDIVVPYAFSDYLDNGFIGRIAEILLFTLAFAVPFFACVRLLSVFQQNVSSIKVMLTFATIVLGWLPVIALTTLIDEPISMGYILGTLVYILLNCLCLYFYKLNPVSSNTKVKGNKFPGMQKKIGDIISPSPIYS